jgi:hypothetical protein
VQVDRLVVEPNFLPEIGFIRRTDMRRNFGQLRYSPRPTNIPHLRKLTMQRGFSYLTNNANRLETREAVGLFQVEFINTDVVGVSYTDMFDRLTRPFDVATAVRIPVGSYDLTAFQVSYAAGPQRPLSGTIVYESGTYYGGTQQSVSVSAARVEVTPRISLEPSVSVNVVDVPQGAFTATIVRSRGTFTVTPRLYVSGIVQYNSATVSVGSNLRMRWEYLPGSELFVVYTDDYHTDPRASVTRLRNRALVIKINRLFRP